MEQRRTGRTTQLAIQALADVLKHPNYPIYPKDHHNTQQSHKELLSLCRLMVEKLGLEHIQFNYSNTSMVYKPLQWEYQWVYELEGKIRLTVDYSITAPEHVRVLGPAEWTKRYASN